MTDDRRRTPRVPVSLEVQIVGVDPRAAIRHGDLSRTGLFIEIDHEVGEPGQLHTLRLKSRDREVRIEVPVRIARVVRADDILSGSVVSGIGFEMLTYDDDARRDLDEFIAHVSKEPAERTGRSGAEDSCFGSLSIETAWQLRKGEVVGVEVPSPAGGRLRYEGRAIRSRRGKDGSFRTRVDVTTSSPSVERPLEGIRDALIARAVDPRPHLSGDLAHFRVTALLTLAEVEQITGTLEIHRDETVDVVYLRKGRAVDAVGEGDLTPLARLAELCHAERGSFSLVIRPTARPDRIGRSTTSMLLDFAHAEDEAKRAAVA